MSVFFFSLCIGLLASAIGTNTGGTGLLIVPALVVMGLPPHIALGSSRIGALGGMVSGWYAYHKSGNVHTAIGLKTMILTSAGALVGSFSLLGTPPDILEPILGICIIGVTALFLLMKTVGTTRAPQPKAGMRIIGYIINIPIGFFGAYVGGGSGILGRMALMFFFGQNVIESNGTRKLQSIGL